MIPFSELSAYGKLLVGILFLVVVCFELHYLTHAVYLRMHSGRVLLMACSFSAGFLLLTMLMEEFELNFRNTAIRNAVLWVKGLPLLLILAAIAASAALTAEMYVSLSRFRAAQISGESVKEAMDNLPTGICFSLRNGMPLLVNRRMSRIARACTGDDIRNGDLFWQALTKGEVGREVTVLQRGDHPMLKFADGRVFAFQRTAVDAAGKTVLEITAADSTEPFQLSIRLNEENRALEAMNRRLRQYSRNVTALVRDQEILDARVCIHDNMGQALLMAKYALSDENADISQDTLLSIWKENVSLLRKERTGGPEEDVFRQFCDAAASVGVHIRLQGELPLQNSDAMRLFVAAGRECLTNAVRHAGADELTVASERNGELYRICFANNGTAPQGTIREGGGLSSLRRRISRAGGTMQVQSEPSFLLTVCIPAVDLPGDQEETP
ncbi:MAG: hypothetical protein LKJ76_01060 [Lachnospiraceae bacterium]|jgi:hypothetical protein|nr:hypothetical protein [Lachnospiraceae bacterium]